MNLRTWTFVTAALLVVALAPAAQAGPVVIDGGWYGFCFGGTSGDPATVGCQNDATGTTGNDFTFTATDNVYLKVTDAFDHGDTFRVFNLVSFLFATPVVGTSPGSVTDPDLAFADPLYSSGSIVLGPGSYDIRIFVDASPWGGGGAYMEVETVPEPTSLALLGGALALGAIRRRLKG